MGHGFCVRIQGDMALFTQPAMKAERFTFPIITPSAARGVIESVYWHPGLKLVVDSILVVNQIRYDSIRRNEVGAVATLASIKRAYIAGGDYHIDCVAERQQRASVILREVDYCVRVHFELIPEKMNPVDNEKKFYNMFLRRLRQGQHYAQPYLGCREFPARVSLLEGDLPESFYRDIPEQDLGFLLYDINYGETDCQPIFFHAVMRNGVVIPEVAQ